VVGLAGLLDLGYVADLCDASNAVGAYSATRYARRLPTRCSATNFGLSFWICLPLAGILAAFWGVLLGFPVLRLRGDYLAIVTLAFGEIIRLVMINWQSLTGGPNGITGIPRPTLFGIPLHAGRRRLSRETRHRILADPPHRVPVLPDPGAGAAHQLGDDPAARLPIGRAWEALREDEIACRALGINTTTTKLTAFATGAMFGGFAGAFFADAAGLHQPGILHLPGIGAGAGDRRARRHGLAARRRARGARHDRRLRAVPRPSTSTACWCSAWRWC
jgi:branched-chain amino acid transport system permease protein